MISTFALMFSTFSIFFTGNHLDKLVGCRSNCHLYTTCRTPTCIPAAGHEKNVASVERIKAIFIFNYTLSKYHRSKSNPINSEREGMGTQIHERFLFFIGNCKSRSLGGIRLIGLNVCVRASRLNVAVNNVIQRIVCGAQIAYRTRTEH